MERIDPSLSIKSYMESLTILRSQGKRKLKGTKCIKHPSSSDIVSDLHIGPSQQLPCFRDEDYEAQAKPELIKC